MESFEAFGYKFDIESMELSYVLDGKANAEGVGELARHVDPFYDPITQTLTATLQFKDGDTPFYYEYAIVKDGDKFRFREIQSQREGLIETGGGLLELIDEEDQIILRRVWDEANSYSFHIPKMVD